MLGQVELTLIMLILALTKFVQPFTFANLLSDFLNRLNNRISGGLLAGQFYRDAGSSEVNRLQIYDIVWKDRPEKIVDSPLPDTLSLKPC